MSGGYDAIVDVDDEGDLGHTDLQEDLEFHSSTFTDASSTNRKYTPSSTTTMGSGLPLPVTAAAASTTGGGTSSKRYLWTLSFYAQFFDVDTNSVLARCWAALWPRANFLDVLEGNPDLYGPFWIATTVVLILFLSGTISQYVAQTGDERFAYDFELLSGMFFSFSLDLLFILLSLVACPSRSCPSLGNDNTTRGWLSFSWLTNWASSLQYTHFMSKTCPL
jgi:hypothetical protein